jgi:hypothetical protein
MLKLCPSVAAILAFGWTQNHTFCKGMSMAHFSQFAFKCLVVSDENNFSFTIGSHVTIVLWWWPSKISGGHRKKLNSVRDHPIIHVQFCFNQISSFREKIFIIIFSSPGQRPCELLPSGFVHR